MTGMGSKYIRQYRRRLRKSGQLSRKSLIAAVSLT
jgi:hypothetical protein